MAIASQFCSFRNNFHASYFHQAALHNYLYILERVSLTRGSSNKKARTPLRHNNNFLEYKYGQYLIHLGHI